MQCFIFQKPENGTYVPSILFDGANGVGALKIKVGLLHLGDSLQVQLYNDGTGRLNHLVSTKYTTIKSVILHPRKSGRTGIEWNVSYHGLYRCCQFVGWKQIS
jgi:hypothetical protein